MKRLLLALAFLVPTAWGQALGPTFITTTSSATGGCAQIDTTSNKGTVGIQVTGTWTGTLQPELQISPTGPPVNVSVTPVGSTTAQTTITANGSYTTGVAGATTFLLCGPTATGTATVWLTSSTVSAKGGTGAGGAGATSFSAITTGTNNGQTLTLGNGSTLTSSGTGAIIATDGPFVKTFPIANQTITGLDGADNLTVTSTDFPSEATTIHDGLIENHSAFASALQLFTHATANFNFRAPTIDFFESRGTQGGPTGVKSGDALLHFNVGGFDGTSYTVSGNGGSFQLNVNATEDWSASAHGSNAIFSVVANGATLSTRSILIGNNAFVALGDLGFSTPLFRLQTVGSQSLNLGAANSAPTDGNLQTGSLVPWLDEVGGANGNLKFRAKYSTSAFHTFTIPADTMVSGVFNSVNITPVTVSAAVATDQLLMAATIPAGVMNSVGRTLRVWLAGVYSTPAASVATVNLKLKLCSNSGCAGGTVVTLASITSGANPGSVTNNAFNETNWTSTQTAGVSAVFESHGTLGIDLGALNTSPDSFFNDTNTAVSAAIDSTLQTYLQVTGAFSVASASNSFTQRQLIIDSVN